MTDVFPRERPKKRRVAKALERSEEVMETRLACFVLVARNNYLIAHGVEKRVAAVVHVR